MASSLRLPVAHPLSAIRSGKGFSPFYPVASPPCQCRRFSQAPQLTGKPMATQNLSVPSPPQPSMRTRQKTMGRAEVPQDMGLLPGTFIRPMWSAMPSIFEQPRERLQMEWLWLRLSFGDFAGLIKYYWSDFKEKSIGFRDRREIAQSLHEKMYTAFARGDINTLNKTCCKGLANDLAARINQRRKDEKVTWTLDKYHRGPSTYFTGVRILSDRATTLPEVDGTGLRQVVVRITSRQSKGRTKQPSTKGSPAESENMPTTTQDCTEHIVLQRMRWAGREEPWRIWGHTTPTTVEDLDHPLFVPGLSTVERLEALKNLNSRSYILGVRLQVWIDLSSSGLCEKNSP